MRSDHDGMTMGIELLIFTVLLPFATATLAPWLGRRLDSKAGWVLALAPVAIAVVFVRTLPMSPGAVHTAALPWVPDLGVELAFLVDGLSTLFVLMISVIGALVLIYSGGYLAGDERIGRFYAYILLFMGAMLGVVLSDNVITLFVFWELTSVCSYLLIGFSHLAEDSRTSALKALLVTGAGGLLLLAGLLLMMIAGAQLGLEGVEAGRLSALATVDLRGHGLYAGIFWLVLFGCVTKSAQVPFHFWLPAAMAGPTPVSSFLHSATMVKAGIYLLARLHPILGGTPLWQWTVTVFGVVTMVIGALMALGQKDLKRILAYSTLAILGMLTMLLGVGSELTIKSMVVLLLAHALYKAALFQVAGIVDHETGTRDITTLGGLRRYMPWAAAAGMIAALSNAGAPPMFGFIGKELLYQAKLDLQGVGAWLIVAAVVANVALVASALMVSVWPFFGELKPTPKKPHEAPWSMLIGPIVLSGFTLFRGLRPHPFEVNVGSAAATAILGRPVEMHLALWHGVDPGALAVMALSVATLALGLVVYRALRRQIEPAVALAAGATAIGPARWYELALQGLYSGADQVTRAIQTGYLRHYLLVILVATTAVAGPPLLRAISPDAFSMGIGWRLYEMLLAALIVAGAVLAIFLRSRLSAVASLGVSGLCVAVLFALFSAPDLAMTQAMVETLSVILLVLVFYRLPSVVRRSSSPQRVRDLAVALAGGALMALLVVASAPVHLDPEVSRYFLEQSYPAAHGRNVVNVILVDFRAFDTMGEITVLAVAGLGVFALLKLILGRAGEGPG